MKVRKVSSESKFEYEKSCSSIGSTRAAKTLNNFTFEFYCTPKQSLRQRLVRRWAK